MSISTLQCGLASPSESLVIPVSSKSLSVRSNTFSWQEAELRMEARASQLSSVRLQLLNLKVQRRRF